MLLRDWIVMIVLFGLVTGICYLIAAENAENYGVENMSDPAFQEKYSTLKNSTGLITQMYNATKSTEGMSVVGTFTTMFGATFSVISLVFASIGIVHSTLTNFMVDFGVPSVLANLVIPSFIAIATVIIIFVIISSLTKGRM